MADTDVLIKDLPLTETVNDSDDLVTEDSSPTTHRIKASVVKNYINAEQNEELDGIKVDLDNTNANIGSLSSKVDDATTTVSSMQTNLNSMDGRVQANADGISELNSALDTTNKNVSQNASDISSLNSALADIPLIQYGRYSSGTLTAGTVYSVDITFSKAFSSTPIVACSCRTGFPHSAFASANEVTSTGFTLYYIRTSGTSSLITTWTAIGAK